MLILIAGIDKLAYFRGLATWIPVAWFALFMIAICPNVHPPEGLFIIILPFASVLAVLSRDQNGLKSLIGEVAKGLWASLIYILLLQVVLSVLAVISDFNE